MGEAKSGDYTGDSILFLILLRSNRLKDKINKIVYKIRKSIESQVESYSGR